MEPKKSAAPTPADILGVQMAAFTRLIVHLDERGVLNAEAFLIELAQFAPSMPAGMQAAQRVLLDNAHQQLEASRGRRGPPTSGRH